MSAHLGRSRATLTLAHRNAVIDAIRRHPELTNGDLAKRMRCSTVTVWNYRKTMPAVAQEPLQTAPDSLHCFRCESCDAEVVVGPISARGPRKCSACRGAAMQGRRP